MKRLLILILAGVLIFTLGLTPIAAAPKGIDVNGPHFNLNLIGKAKDMPGDYNNPDRHTMFVPLSTDGMTFPINTPNNLTQTTMDGIKITITQPADTEDFAVIDGNATDGYGELQMGPGKYWCYIAVKAKDPKAAGTVRIDGWVEAYDNLGQLWYYINVGYVSVSKNKEWTNATDLFFVNTTEDTFDFLTGSETGWVPGYGMWVFDYMAGLDAWVTDDYDLSDLAYFWQVQNDGAKLIQVRFYPM